MLGVVRIKEYGKPPSFSMREALSYLGPDADTEQVRNLLNHCIEDVKDRLIYRACYTEYEIGIDGDEVDLGFMKLRSKALAKYLDGCFGIILFAATVGVEMDRMIMAYSCSAPWRGCAMDAVGSERVETLCNRFCFDIGVEYEQIRIGLKNRFSPGYADFPLLAQRDIFEALGATGRLGITLNDSLIMSPSKSVTAIIGMYRK